jgi:hypothetical protein
LYGALTQLQVNVEKGGHRNYRVRESLADILNLFVQLKNTFKSVPCNGDLRLLGAADSRLLGANKHIVVATSFKGDGLTSTYHRNKFYLTKRLQRLRN